jgi:hypothetical protein
MASAHFTDLIVGRQLKSQSVNTPANIVVVIVVDVVVVVDVFVVDVVIVVDVVVHMRI